jgi:hypothetical protein
MSRVYSLLLLPGADQVQVLQLLEDVAQEAAGGAGEVGRGGAAGVLLAAAAVDFAKSANAGTAAEVDLAGHGGCEEGRGVGEREGERGRESE